MRFLSLVLLGLSFVVSCSEEDHRIDLSYTGEQLSLVEAPIGGIEAGHMLISGDGSIRSFNIFGTPATDSQHSSVSFFSLYAAEEGNAAVVRIMGKGQLDDSVGIAGVARSSGSRGGAEGLGYSGVSKGTGRGGSSEGLEGLEAAGGSVGTEGLGSSGGSVGTESSGGLVGTEGSGSSGGSVDTESSGGLVWTESLGEAIRNFEAPPGFNEAVFHNAFPLVQVDLLDDEVPLQVCMSAWSPFIPIDTLNSNLPVAVFEWELTNPGKKAVSYSIALTMQNPLRTGDKNRPFSLKESIITPYSVSGWKGFTFSNGEDNPLLQDAGTVRVLSSSENAFYVPFLGDRQKAWEQFWTDFSTDGKLESRNDIIGSSGRLEARSNLVSPSGRIESRGDEASSSGRLEKRGDNVRYSDEDPGMAALYSTGVLEPGESVTIPFLFSWYVPSRHAVGRLGADISEKEATYKSTGILFENKPLASGDEDKPSSICIEDTPIATCNEDKPSNSRYEVKPSVSRFEGIDDITSYMVSSYKNLRDKTMQFSHSMITSTIPPETLDKVLSGFADAVEQRGKNMHIISNPFPYKGATGDLIDVGANGDPTDERTNGDPVVEGTNRDLIDVGANGDPIDIGTKGDSIDEGTYEDPAADGENANPVYNKSTWDTYYSSSGFSYDKEARVMKFSPEKDVLPVRFFWATDNGWGTINVSRARIVLDCIYGSLELKQLFLEGRSFFVFREFVPSHNAVISYDNETLKINSTEELSITEGGSFTMEIP